MSKEAFEWIAIGIMWLLVGVGFGTCNWLSGPDFTNRTVCPSEQK